MTPFCYIFFGFLIAVVLLPWAVVLLPSVSRACRVVLLAYLQVREARTLLSGEMMVILMVFCDFSCLYVVAIIWHDLCCCLGMNCIDSSEEQWRSLLNSPKRACLAQAGLTGTRLCIFPRRVAQATHCTFGRANVSLRRGGSRLSENARRVLILEVELSPRRRELAWARVFLAWARPFCLSEMLGENVVGIDIFFDFKSGQHACMSILLSLWTGWPLWMRWCMSYDLWALTWCEHDDCMKWFMKLKWWVWYEFNMRYERVGINVTW